MFLPEDDYTDTNEKNDHLGRFFDQLGKRYCGELTFMLKR